MANADDWAELGRSIAFLRSQETTAGSEGMTLKKAIAEGIYMLDSESGAVNVDTSTIGTREGKLQQLQNMRAKLFGEGDDPGIFDSMEQAIEASALIE